ncbi:MAG: hypothetical protein Q9M39_03835 [Sulfurovum sp.]|nr:hypothetical protein [Sulfurovum sp.]
MERETQVFHLARMMQKYSQKPQYELALPFVKIRKSVFEKLSVNDVLLLDMKVLTFILLKNDVLCANLALQHVESSEVIVIIEVKSKTKISKKSTKYKIIKPSLGTCDIKSLEVGKHLSWTPFDLEKIILLCDEKKLAEGSLVRVDNKLALKVDRLF